MPSPIFSVLKAHRVPFVVIGGHAVNYHGVLRTTEDCDVVFRRGPGTERRLLAALEEIHAAWISNEKDPRTGIERLVPVTLSYVRSCHAMLLCTDLGYLDVFDYVPGIPSAAAADLFDDAKLADGVRYVSLPWLRRLKQASGRPKDLLDLEALAGEPNPAPPVTDRRARPRRQRK